MNKQTELEEHQLKIEAVLTKIKKIEEEDGFQLLGRRSSRSRDAL